MHVPVITSSCGDWGRCSDAGGGCYYQEDGNVEQMGWVDDELGEIGKMFKCLIARGRGSIRVSYYRSVIVESSDCFLIFCKKC